MSDTGRKAISSGGVTIGAHSRFSSYAEAVAAHEWSVPERYNIAQDVCDKHPPEKLAMLWEDYRGNERAVAWGELQEASNRLASVLRAHGVEVGDRVAMLLTPRPETAAAFLGTFKAGANFRYQFHTRGTETITAVCSDKAGPVDGVRHDFGRQAFTETRNYSRSVARDRAISVVPVTPGQPAAAPKKPDAPRELFRTAIKVTVD